MTTTQQSAYSFHTYIDKYQIWAQCRTSLLSTTMLIYRLVAISYSFTNVSIYDVFIIRFVFIQLALPNHFYCSACARPVEWAVIYLLILSFSPLSSIVLLDLGTVPTVWYFLFFISFHRYTAHGRPMFYHLNAWHHEQIMHSMSNIIFLLSDSIFVHLQFMKMVWTFPYFDNQIPVALENISAIIYTFKNIC